MTTLIACDGSSHQNGKGGPMGWAWARDDGAWLSNSYYTGSNQRAELWGIWSVLKFHPKGSLIIQLDSQYALNVTEKWAAGWARRNWVKADGKKVLNRDLIEPILALKQARKDPIEFQWVKGHRKDNAFPLNTIADQRAGEASARAKLVNNAQDSLKLYLDSKGRTFMPQEQEMMIKVSAGLAAEKIRAGK